MIAKYFSMNCLGNIEIFFYIFEIFFYEVFGKCCGGLLDCGTETYCANQVWGPDVSNLKSGCICGKATEIYGMYPLPNLICLKFK